MTTELLDIVDTAVKIGLGALISGVAAYKITQLNQSREAQRVFQRRFLETIDNASDLAERYFNRLRFLFARIDTVIINSNENLNNVTEEEWVSIEKEDEALTFSWTDRDKSLNKLRLLQADKAAKRLLEISDLEKEFREKFFFNKYGSRLSSRRELHDFIKRGKKVKNEFHKELSVYFREGWKI